MEGAPPEQLGPRRALLECADETAARAAAGDLSRAGFEVLLCDGRGPGGRGCPLLRGERCKLVETAGVVLNALPGLPAELKGVNDPGRGADSSHVVVLPRQARASFP